MLRTFSIVFSGVGGWLTVNVILVEFSPKLNQMFVCGSGAEQVNYLHFSDCYISVTNIPGCPADTD